MVTAVDAVARPPDGGIWNLLELRADLVDAVSCRDFDFEWRRATRSVILLRFLILGEGDVAPMGDAGEAVGTTPVVVQ
jgi:hypothetical protein